MRIRDAPGILPLVVQLIGACVLVTAFGLAFSIFDRGSRV